MAEQKETKKTEAVNVTLEELVAENESLKKQVEALQAQVERVFQEMQRYQQLYLTTGLVK